MKKDDKKETYKDSSSEEFLSRTKLGQAVREILEEKGLRQRAISDLLKIDQAEVSKLMNGKYELFSEKRLIGFLNKLNKQIKIQVAEKNMKERTIMSTFSMMERSNIQAAIERVQILSPSLQAELQRVTEVTKNLDISLIDRIQEQLRIINESPSPLLDEVRRASELASNINYKAVAQLEEAARNWTEPYKNIHSFLNLYSNKIAEINMAMSPFIGGLNTRVLEIQKAISGPLTQALENYQHIFRDPFNGLFPVGFFKEISQQEKFVGYCRDEGWVPHPVLYSYFGDDFFDLSDAEKEERIKNNLGQFNSLLWNRIPRNVMVNGRENRLRQILDAFKIKAYTPVCRAVYPEIEGLTHDYISSDTVFVDSLKKLSKGKRKKVVSEKVNSIFKIDQSPILSLYISKLGGLLGYRTVEILLTVTRAEYIPFDEMTDDLSMNRHFHAHGVPFNATCKNAVNALLLLDIALQSFSALTSNNEEEESVSEYN